MPDNTTPVKGLTQPTPLADYRTWGDILNTDLQLIDSALGSTLVLAITGNTLLNSVQTQNTGYQFSGTIGSVATITWPSFKGLLAVANLTTGGFGISCGITGGNFVTVPNGSTVAVWSDGSNFTLLSASGSDGMTTGTGSTVLQNSPTIISPNLSGTVTGSGTIPNSILVNSTVTVAGQTVALGSSTPVSAANLSNGTSGSGLVVLQTGPTLTSVTISSGTITGLPAPTNPSDAANKSYVDGLATGLVVHTSVSVATTTTLPTNTYSNGTAGVGATLTATSNGALTIDGVSVSATNRVLIKNEAAAANNGIYTVTSAGSGGSGYVLTRATDFNQTSNITNDSYVFVSAGTANASSGWIMTTTGSVTVGTTSIVFTQFSAATSYVAGSGLTLTGNSFALTNNSVTVAGQTVALGGSTAIAAANLSNGVTGSGNIVLTTSPSIASPTITGTVVGAGTIPNSVLVNSSLTVAGQTVSLGGNVSVAAVNLSNGVTGSGNVVLTTSPTIVSPVITGTVSATGVIPNAALVNSSVTVAGQAVSLGGSTAIAAANLSNGVTGSGNIVLATSPTLITPALGVATATSVAASGAITAATLMGGVVTSVQTSNYSVLTGDIGKYFLNTGAVGTVTFSLPVTAAGQEFSFMVVAAQTVIIQAQSGTTITLGTNPVSASGGNITTNLVGSTITLIGISTTQFMAISATGQWTIN